MLSDSSIISQVVDSPIAVVPFAVGVTAKLKDYGVQGEWLTLACICAGAFATYMTIYQPSLWLSISSFLLSGAAAGWYSLLKSVVLSRTASQQG